MKNALRISKDKKPISKILNQKPKNLKAMCKAFRMKTEHLQRCKSLEINEIRKQWSLDT